MVKGTYNKEYYLKNKEKIAVIRRAYEKKWIQTPKGKYSIQKRKAKRRKIEWNLTFDEWWNIWQESGKWDERGCNSEQYVMCRTGDIGAYELGNIRIDKAINNTLEIGLTRDQFGRFNKMELI